LKICQLFSFFFFVLIIPICLRYKDSHPPSPLHTRQLKSQHHEIITTFPNTTPHHAFFLGGGVHLPRTLPTLRFIPLGFLLPGLIDFVFFWWCFLFPCSIGFEPRLEHPHGRQYSPQHPCYRRPGTRFAVRENNQQATVDFSTLFLFKRLPSQDTNTFSDSFYRTELGLPLLLLTLSQLDWLSPYCFSTFLAGTHTYLTGIHNYFLTSQTITTVHHGLPLEGWYCTNSFCYSSMLPTQWAPGAPPGVC